MKCFCGQETENENEKFCRDHRIITKGEQEARTLGEYKS